MNRPRLGCAAALGLIFSLAGARGQFALPDQNAVRSFSGQFIVSRAPDDAPWIRKISTTDTNFVHLEPALLAITAERFKTFLWQQLGLKPDAPWLGKIYLALHPARSLDETVTIVANPFVNHWDYRVELPDTLLSTRYARALVAVLLSEIANRNARTDGPATEIPAWLVDGFARQVLAADRDQILVTPPARRKDGLPAGRFDQTKLDFDALAAARPVLQNLPVLTFDQLSWPTGEQLAGADGGAYFGSAQLFVSELLTLKNGPDKLRALLAELPAHWNWQTAFFAAFAEDFKRPLDVEKWWALRVVNFSTFASGPLWTVAVSRDRLEALMSVPVEVRGDSNALPGHAEISLQAALKNLPRAQRDAVLRIKVRDFALEELRMPPPFGALAENYRAVLADFLGEMKKTAPVAASNLHPRPVDLRPGLAETLNKLDALDRRRREAEIRLASVPENPKVVAP
jgi:hypothetical protein